MATQDCAAGKLDGDARLVVGTFNCEMQLTQQRRMVVTGHIYSDDTPAELNARIDMYQDALDRQLVRCDIVNKRAQIKAQLQGVEQFRDQLAELAKRQDGRRVAGANGATRPPKLSSQEHQQLTNGQHTIEQALKNIERLEADIVIAQKLVDSGAAAP